MAENRNYIPRPSVPNPDLVRPVYTEYTTTNFEEMRWFYVEVLGLYVTYEDKESLYLRTYEEHAHHNIVIRKGSQNANVVISTRVKTPGDVDKAEAYFKELGCKVVRNKNGFVKGIGDAVRVTDPLGYSQEYFYHLDVVERLTWKYKIHNLGHLTRLDHVNIFIDDCAVALDYFQGLGYHLNETYEDENNLFGAWISVTPRVHDFALTGGLGPRIHHTAFGVHERTDVLNLVDKVSSYDLTDKIEQGPGRHGITNALYVYLRDPDGNRVEVFAADYWTGDPENPVVRWNVHDAHALDYWGKVFVDSWFTEGTEIIDVEGNRVVPRDPKQESAREKLVGADGFFYAREGDESSYSKASRSDKVIRDDASGYDER